MSNSTRTMKSTVGEAGRMPSGAPGAPPAARAARGSQLLAEMSARRALSFAAAQREAIHLRILAAYRSQIEGIGSGPSDADLRLFARIAIAEERLRRVFERTKLHPSCNCEVSSIRLATRLRRGDIQ